jgi:hypothetical protein
MTSFDKSSLAGAEIFICRRIKGCPNLLRGVKLVRVVIALKSSLEVFSFRGVGRKTPEGCRIVFAWGWSHCVLTAPVTVTADCHNIINDTFTPDR